MPSKRISLVNDFTDAPGGRFRTQGKYSGQEFREDILIPALSEYEDVVVDLNGALGLPASFLDEAFGSTARKHKALTSRLTIELSDNEVAQEILRECAGPASLSWAAKK